MKAKIKKVLDLVIKDFNSKWRNHEEKEEGLNKYAERIENLLSPEVDLRDLETDSPEETENVLFYRVPIMEAPYCGSLLDTDFEHDYYTHWTPLPKVKEPINNGK